MLYALTKEAFRMVEVLVKLKVGLGLVALVEDTLVGTIRPQVGCLHHSPVLVGGDLSHRLGHQRVER
jgi:hypothetical protein